MLNILQLILDLISFLYHSNIDNAENLQKARRGKFAVAVTRCAIHSSSKFRNYFIMFYML